MQHGHFHGPASGWLFSGCHRDRLPASPLLSGTGKVTWPKVRTTLGCRAQHGRASRAQSHLLEPEDSGPCATHRGGGRGGAEFCSLPWAVTWRASSLPLGFAELVLLPREVQMVGVSLFPPIWVRDPLPE